MNPYLILYLCLIPVFAFLGGIVHYIKCNCWSMDNHECALAFMLSVVWPLYLMLMLPYLGHKLAKAIKKRYDNKKKKAGAV